MYFEEFLTKIQGSAAPSVVLFFGDSESSMTDGYLAVRERFRKDHPDGELKVLDGKEDRTSEENDTGGMLAEAVASARNTGLFSASRMIVLKNASKALGGRSEKNLKPLTDYFDDPTPDTLLVFLAPKMKKEAKAVKTVERRGWVVQCSEIREDRAAGWVRSQAEAMGLALSGDAAQLLTDKVGTDLSYLRRALEQLAVYVLPGKKASLADVRGLPAPGMESENFDLLDAVGTRQTERALRLLGQLTDGVTVGTIMVLYMRVRQWLSAAIWRKKGASQAQWFERNPMNPFMSRTIWEQSSRFSVEELREALKDLIHIQAGLVTGRLSKTAFPVRVAGWVLKRGKNRMAAANGAIR